MRAHDRDLGRRPREVDIRAEVLRAHDVVRAPVCLARDDGEKRDRGLRVGVDQFRSPSNDAVPLLLRPGEEARDVDEGHNGHVEGVTGANEAGRLLRGVDIQRARVLHRLIGDDADGVTLNATEAGDEVRREQRLGFQEFIVVQHRFEDPMHVVRLVR